LAAAEGASLLCAEKIMKFSVSHATIRTSRDHVAPGIIIVPRTSEKSLDSIKHNGPVRLWRIDSNTNDRQNEYRRTNVKIIPKLNGSSIANILELLRP
jgi:hypothetical protein